MAKKDSAAPSAAGGNDRLNLGALRPPLDQVARDVRVVAAARTDLGKQLAGAEAGKAADTDTEIAGQLAQVVAALSAADDAAAAWQQDLAAAAGWWEACLADLGRRHPEAAAS